MWYVVMWCSGMWCGMVGYGGVCIHIYVCVCVCECGAWYALWYDIPNQTKIHIVNDSSTSNKQEQKNSPLEVHKGLSPVSTRSPPCFPLQGQDHPPQAFNSPPLLASLSLYPSEGRVHGHMGKRLWWTLASRLRSDGRWRWLGGIENFNQNCR